MSDDSIKSWTQLYNDLQMVREQLCQAQLTIATMEQRDSPQLKIIDSYERDAAQLQSVDKAQEGQQRCHSTEISENEAS